MNEYKYNTYDYYTINNKENTINSLNPKEFDYNIVNEEHFSNKRKNVSEPNTTFRNKYSTK